MKLKLLLGLLPLLAFSCGEAPAPVLEEASATIIEVPKEAPKPTQLESNAVFEAESRVDNSTGRVTHIGKAAFTFSPGRVFTYQGRALEVLLYVAQDTPELGLVKVFFLDDGLGVRTLTVYSPVEKVNDYSTAPHMLIDSKYLSTAQYEKGLVYSTVCYTGTFKLKD